MKQELAINMQNEMVCSITVLTVSFSSYVIKEINNFKYQFISSRLPLNVSLLSLLVDMLSLINVGCKGSQSMSVDYNPLQGLPSIMFQKQVWWKSFKIACGVNFCWPLCNSVFISLWLLCLIMRLCEMWTCYDWKCVCLIQRIQEFLMKVTPRCF